MSSLNDPPPGRRDPRDPWESLGGFRLSSSKEAAGVVDQATLNPTEGQVQDSGLSIKPPGRKRPARTGAQPDVKEALNRPSVGSGERTIYKHATNLEAPMPGQVVAVLVAAGDRVVKGQELVVLEAMKMEHSIIAPTDAVVEAVLCVVGDKVDRGRTLVELAEPSPAPSSEN